MINIFKSLKLVRYSNGFISTFLLYIAFTGFGVYLILTTENTTLSCALLMLGPCLLSNIFINLAEHESIATSELGNALKRTIPNIILLISSVFTFVVLAVIMFLRCDADSPLYSIYNDWGLNEVYVSGLWVIILAVIVYPILSSNMMKGVIIMVIVSIPAYFINYLLVRWEKSLYEESFLISPSYNTLLSIGVVVFIITLVVTLVHKPLAAYSETDKKWIGIKKMVIPLGVVVIVILVATNIYNNRKAASVDGIYHYSELFKEYEKLATPCKSNPQACPESNGYSIETRVTVDMEECYYNADTFDAYCMFTITLPKGILIENIEIIQDSIHVSTDPYDYNFELISNCNSIMDLEYKVNNTKPNVAEVQLLINGIPNTKEMFDDRTLNLMCYHTDINFPKDETTTTYKDEEQAIFVSSTSMIHEGSKPATDIVLELKNGKEIIIMSDGILADGVEKYQNNAITKYIFYNTINPDKIENVRLENKGHAYKPDLTKAFALTENSHLRKTVYYKENEDKRGLIATTTIEWLQAPDNKYTDYINLVWDRRNFTFNSINVTQSALKTTVANDKEWVTKTLSLPYTMVYDEFFDTSSMLYEGFDISKKNDIKPDNCYINGVDNDCLVHIFDKFFEDTSTETYTNHTITIEIDMNYSGKKSDTFPIYCDYYHMLEDITTDNKGEVVLDKILKSTKCGKVGRYFGVY